MAVGLSHPGSGPHNGPERLVALARCVTLRPVRPFRDVTPRAAVVLDDSPQRVLGTLAELLNSGQAPPAAVHVVCSSARVAERMAPALTRWSVRGRGRKQPRVVGGLVAGTSYAHVLGGEQGGAARDADCCLRAAEWLFNLVRAIREQGFAIDAVAGPNGPLRALLLRGAVEHAGTAADRLYLYRGSAVGGSKTPRSAVPRSGALLLVQHVPPSRRDGDASESYREILTKRAREWGVGKDRESVVVDVARRRVRIGVTDVSLTPDQTFWYAAFAIMPGRIFPHREFGSALTLDGHGQPVLSASTTTPDVDGLQVWLRHFRQTFCCAQPRNRDRFGQLLVNACDLRAPQLGSMLAKIAGALHSAVGPGAEPYCIRARKGAGYRLDLPAPLVTVILPPAN